MSDDGIRTAQITITRTFHPDRDDHNNADEVVVVDVSDGLTIIEQLGLVEFARMSLAADIILDAPPDED